MHVCKKKGNKSMKKQKTSALKKTLVFNRQFLLFLMVFLACLSFSISFFESGEIDIGIGLLIVGLFISIGVFTSPLYFAFSKEELTVVWLFQNKRIIPWYSVKSVIELKWGEVNRDFPKYEIIYHLNYKGHVVSKQFDIPRNRRTKALIEKYVKHKIV